MQRSCALVFILAVGVITGKAGRESLYARCFPGNCPERSEEPVMAAARQNLVWTRKNNCKDPGENYKTPDKGDLNRQSDTARPT
jgi:hypothetical protein